MLFWNHIHGLHGLLIYFEPLEFECAFIVRTINMSTIGIRRGSSIEFSISVGTPFYFQVNKM